MDESTCACCNECGTAAHNECWLNKDCCGLICALVTDGLLAFGEYVIVYVVLQPWFGNSPEGLLHKVVFSTLIGLAILSHFRAMTTDPGAVPPNAVPDDFEPGDTKSFRVCLKCDTYKPVRTHHCSICQRCIIKMDHHCPWVNNCVGLGNHKYFLLFLFYVNMAALYALMLLMYRFVHCMGKGSSARRQYLRAQRKIRTHFPGNSDDSAVMNGFANTPPPEGMYPECEPSTGASILMFAIIVEAILFGLFTFCMMCDQWSVVLTSATKIDRLKGDAPSKRGMCDNLTEVFGGEPRFSIFWLLPTSVKFSRPEQVYGYRVHDEEELKGMTTVTVPDEPTKV